jgi:hypothetical protein
MSVSSHDSVAVTTTVSVLGERGGGGKGGGEGEGDKRLGHGTPSIRKGTANVKPLDFGLNFDISVAAGL